MTAALIPDNGVPNLATLNLTLSPDDSGVALDLTLQGGAPWYEVGSGRAQFALRGANLVITLDPEWEATGVMPGLQPVEGGGFAGEILFTEPEFRRQERLLTLNVTPDIFSVSFSPLLAHCTILHAEGLWPHDFSPNQQAVAKRAIAKAIRATFPIPLAKISGYANESIPAKPLAAPDFTPILNGHHEDVLTLATQLGLDPMTDFAGGNFLGVSLGEANLSGADLRGINLRGADLCDADLSGANLRGANLGGADLTGAFLENADLSGANLQRASLALVNLAGVNLTGANLTGANLSEAHWIGAILDQTRLGDNTGLSPELQQQLIQRGAIAP
ncbi:pentapeptide repeat-containing protein [Spirulina sp. CCNP1310]|uniref:pentapeptide repeat-containing protein n=1 Tax=Spirulina sp. CCNP1310 TaxID=3110249 RepID=UPI002B21F9B7|nr:pentapeptide repeat-containing protein [Spirulina sp. CCNP1310]MEA5419688.1 pentapeptide repeat-containing protein [Spirulina sp. CCNP1310]